MRLYVQTRRFMMKQGRFRTRRKQITSILLSLVMSLTFLVGCRNTQLENKETTTTTIATTPPPTTTRPPTTTTTTQPPTTTTATVLPIEEAGDLEVHFLDVDQGHATLFKQGDYEILIDGGGQSSSGFVVAYLKKLEIDNIELMIATHFDEDHIAGLIGVMNVFNVDQVLCGTNPKDTRVCNSFVRTIDEKNLPSTTPQLGDRFVVGSMEVNIVGPYKYGNEDHNEDSIISNIKFGDKSFLIGGDTNTAAEQRLLKQDIKADVMLANHHGGIGSNSSTWLDKVSPAFIVIACGSDNTYGHPDNAVLKRFSDVGSEWFRTDENGTIIFKSDGKDVSLASLERGSAQAADTQPGEDSIGKAVTNTVGNTNTTTAQQTTVEETTVATTTEKITETEPSAQPGSDYVLNTNTKKFHRPGCASVKKMKDKNRQDVHESRDTIISWGYVPCKNCNP